MKKQSTTKTVSALIVLFVVVSAFVLIMGSKFIYKQLLKSNEDAATDISQLVNNNFDITDDEVEYMKSLTFNEMEKDTINNRLMNIGSGIDLNSNIINVYLVAPLKDSEVKYYVDKSNSEFFDCEAGTPLDAVWLLNGKIGSDGEFEIAQRDDIYRYTKTTTTLEDGFKSKKAFGTFTSDEWGDVISGYSPVYTTEGNYVGMLGIDTDPDIYRQSVNNVVVLFILLYLITSLVLVSLFFVFYSKYIKAKESKVYFDFYSRMSHDMRTPMNGILGITHLAKGNSNIDELHDYLNKIDESGKYLSQLINDTLDVGRISNGKLILNKHDTCLSDVVENVCDMTNPFARTREINFTTKSVGTKYESRTVVADELRFKQIFMNLINNAMKYTPKGGSILFKREYSCKDNKHLHCKFTVKDTGIGLSDEFIKNSIFMPYTQDSNELQDLYTGSGLGLYITKSIVDAMGGKISVKSKKGEGTTFTLTFDLEFSYASLGDDNEKLVKEDESILNGKKILLCEDHPLNAEIVSRILKNKGLIVDVANNGKIGLDMFKLSSIDYYDAILMDVNMPVMGGLEATKSIRALKRVDSKTVPIIAITANAYEKDIKASIDCGMNYHLSKPIDTQLLYKILADFIKKQKNSIEEKNNEQ